MGLSQTHKKIAIGRDPERFIQHQMKTSQGQSPAIIKPYFAQQISAKYQLVAAQIKTPWLFFLVPGGAVDATDNLTYHLSIIPRFNILRANVVNHIISKPGFESGQAIISKYFSSFTKIYDPDYFLLRSKPFKLLPVKFPFAVQVFSSNLYEVKDNRIVFRRKKIRETFEHLFFKAGNQGRSEHDNSRISERSLTSSFFKTEQFNISQIKERFIHDAIENWRSSVFKSSLSEKPPMLRYLPMNARNPIANLDVGEQKWKLPANYTTIRRSARIAALKQGNLLPKRPPLYQRPSFHELPLSSPLLKPGIAQISQTATIHDGVTSLHKKARDSESHSIPNGRNKVNVSSEMPRGVNQKPGVERKIAETGMSPSIYLNISNFMEADKLRPLPMILLNHRPTLKTAQISKGNNPFFLPSTHGMVNDSFNADFKQTTLRNEFKPLGTGRLDFLFPNTQYENFAKKKKAAVKSPQKMNPAVSKKIGTRPADEYVVIKKRNQWASKANSSDEFKPGQQQEKYHLNPFAEEGLSGGVSRYRHFENDKNLIGSKLYTSPGVRQTSLATPEFSANKPYPAMTHHYTHKSRTLSETVQAKKTVRKEEIQMADDSYAARAGKSPSMADFNVNGLADKVYELILGRIKRERAMRGH